TGVTEFTIDENENPISRARPKKIALKVPPKDIEEIFAYRQLKLIQDAVSNLAKYDKDEDEENNYSEDYNDLDNYENDYKNDYENFAYNAERPA
ncbi:6551_t:CDS:2, partial [Ambispora leptoticha]